MSLKKYIEVPIDRLVSAQWNYKKSDDDRSLKLMEKLKKNLTRIGQIENLIVRTAKVKGYYEVVNGNHRLQALTEIGVKKVMCYNLGKITLAHAARIAIETNETKFEADPHKLGELIAHISESFDSEDLLSTMPFSEFEMQKHLATIDPDTPPQPPEDGNAPDPIGEKEDWTTIELKLPTDIAVLFDDQITRVKKAIYPRKNPNNVSIVPAIECITQHIAQLPTGQLNGQ